MKSAQDTTAVHKKSVKTDMEEGEAHAGQNVQTSMHLGARQTDGQISTRMSIRRLKVTTIFNFSFS